MTEIAERLAAVILGTNERAGGMLNDRRLHRPYKFALLIKESGLYGIYVVAAQVKGVVCSPIKIGITDDPVARMGAMQCNNHLKLVIHQNWWLPDRDVAKRAEKNFKLHNEAHNIRGEWYDMDPDDAVKQAGREISDIGATFETEAVLIERMKEIAAGMFRM